MRKSIVILAFLSGVLYAQDADILLNHDLYHYMDRLDIKGVTDTLVHTDIKPYRRNALARVMRKVDINALSKTEAGWHVRMQMLADDQMALEDENSGILRYFYRNQRDLLHVNHKHLQLFVNPVLYTNIGADQNTFLSPEGERLPIFTNSRGVQVRGTFLNKVGFHTEVYDNYNRIHQFIYNQYQQTLRLPGESFIKTFGQPNGVDFFSSRAYLTFSPIKNMRIKFGKDRSFWGNGFQSLLLSDHAVDPLLLNITTRVWKLEYVNQFTQMVDFLINRNDNEGTLPRKYGAFHMLNYKPNAKFSIGIFESVVYTPRLANGYRGLELQYLNPIIFYRAAEQFIGSPDNAILGLNMKANLFNHLQLYGQLLLDDYNYGVRNEGTGYWGNKLGWQAGLKYIDLFNIPTLDAQFEANQVRPYTYQHFNIASNYTNYGQSLGHGAGANLRDYRVMLRYHPFPAWNIHLGYFHMIQGRDPAYLQGINYGALPDRATGNRPVNNIEKPDFDHLIGQGESWTTQQLYGRISWQLGNTDIFGELEGRYRRENNLNSLSLLMGIRANISPRMIKY
ncbi:MAG: capsule assembly Wzi family protein [Bacteroidota bacterium]